MQGVTFEGSDEYTFLGSGCNIYEHIFSRSSASRRRRPRAVLDRTRVVYYLNTILLRSRGARWLTRGEDRSDEAWRQIQWGEPLFRETYFVVLGTGRECSADPTW